MSEQDRPGNLSIALMQSLENDGCARADGSCAAQTLPRSAGMKPWRWLPTWSIPTVAKPQETEFLNYLVDQVKLPGAMALQSCVLGEIFYWAIPWRLDAFHQ